MLLWLLQGGGYKTRCGDALGDDRRTNVRRFFIIVLGKGDNMQEVLRELAVLLVILCAGAYLGKRGVLGEACILQLNKFVVNVAFPALMIASLDQDFTAELFRDSVGLMVISWLCFGAVVLFLEAWKRVSRRPPQELGLLRFLVLFGNTAFMGYPVVRAVYGSTGVFYASIFNLAHHFVSFSYGLSLLQPGRRAGIKKWFGNIGFLATIVGFLIFLIPGTLPYTIHRPLEWIGDITIPVCLLNAGARLGTSKLRDLAKPHAIWGTSLIRLLAFPAVLFLVLRALKLPEQWIIIPTVIFGTPVALTAGLFAEEYGNDACVANRAVVLSNLLAVVTMPVWVWILLRWV